MKAKLYIHEDKIEIKLADDAVFAPKKTESKEEFIERVRQVVVDEYIDDEWDLIEIDKEVVATNDDETLQSALENSSGLQKKLILDVLGDRGLAKVVKKRVYVEKRTVEQAKESKEHIAAEKRIGDFVSFSPHGKTDIIIGKIVGVALNKTNTKVYFTIVDIKGARKCCAAHNETIKKVKRPEGFVDKAVVRKDNKEKVAKRKADANKETPEDADHSITDASTDAQEGLSEDDADLI